MRLPLKILLSCLLTTVFPLNTIACGIHYERLNKDVNKWDIDSIFNNSNLLKSINNSLHNFYEPCFVNKNIEKAHVQNPNVYFLNNAKGVYIPVLPFANQAIVNYEKHTNNGINGLDNLEKIKQNIKFSYLQLDNHSEIYVKPNSSIESGLFIYTCIWYITKHTRLSVSFYNFKLKFNWN
ncbi:hypothetical protein [Spiroplasma endosymbiont of Nebria brevicollis]|uniref:hypothetical protein n=1 Tax=Spiroplasma endosymbiont of Nebria brevicollis TaxID=3066284 RepID=UPI00313BF268